MKAAICLLLLVFGQPAEGPGAKASDTLTRKERYQRAMDAALKKEIERVEWQLETSEEELKDARLALRAAKKSWKRWNSKREKRDKVKLKDSRAHTQALEKVRTLVAQGKDSKKRLRGLKKGEIEVQPKIRLERLEVGQIGHLYRTEHLEVFQILTDLEMLVAQMSFHGGRGTIPGGPMTPSYYTTDATVLIKGVSTTGLVTKKRLTFDQLFEVSGTRTYSTTNGGSNTAFVLEPFTIDWPVDDQDTSKRDKKKKSRKKKRSSENKSGKRKSDD